MPLQLLLTTQNTKILVKDLLALAKEEIEHFEMVHNIIIKRGLKLGRERKDEYVNELYLYMKKNGNGGRVSSLSRTVIVLGYDRSEKL